MSLFHTKDFFLKNSMVSANLIWHFKEVREADGWFLMTNFFASTNDLLFDAHCTG